MKKNPSSLVFNSREKNENVTVILGAQNQMGVRNKHCGINAYKTRSDSAANDPRKTDCSNFKFSSAAEGAWRRVGGAREGDRTPADVPRSNCTAVRAAIFGAHCVLAQNKEAGSH